MKFQQFYFKSREFAFSLEISLYSGNFILWNAWAPWDSKMVLGSIKLWNEHNIADEEWSLHNNGEQCTLIFNIYFTFLLFFPLSLLVSFLLLLLSVLPILQGMKNSQATEQYEGHFESSSKYVFLWCWQCWTTELIYFWFSCFVIQTIPN